MADDDWRFKRAVELGLIDTGPWLGGKAPRPATPPRPEPPAPRAAEPPPAPPPPPATVLPPLTTPPAPPPAPALASLARPKSPSSPAQNNTLRPWHIAAAAAAIVIAFAIGWLLRAATAPSSFDQALASAPAGAPPPAPASAPIVTPRPAPAAARAETATPPPAASRPIDTLPQPETTPQAAPEPARPAPVVRDTPTAERPARPRRWTPPRAVAAAGRDFKPSFNCRRASATVTRQICQDSDLAALDREMASLYRLRQQTADRDGQLALDADQSDFLNARGRCISPACIERSYRNRIDELR